jgi:hypothetical protein
MKKFKVGDVVWFTKSMRKVRIIERLKDKYCGQAMFTVERIDNGKQMTATEAGLEKPKCQSGV